MKRICLIAVLAVALLIFGCIGGQPQPTPTPVPTTTPGGAVAPTTTPVPGELSDVFDLNVTEVDDSLELYLPEPQ